MKKLAAIGFFLSVWVGAVHAQPVVDGFTLDQISFDSAHTGNVPCSEYGDVGFAVRQTPGQVHYIQVVAQIGGSSTAPAWIVQNLPAVSGAISQSRGVDLTLLGVQRGTCITGAQINYVITVTGATLTTAPAFSGSIPVFAGQRTERTEGKLITNPGSPGLLPPVAGTGPMGAANAPARLEVRPEDAIVAAPGPLQVMSPGMGNIVQNKNECGPGAVTNSMQWLQSNNRVDLKGETPAETLAKIKSDMSWTAFGVSDTLMVKGKLNYSQRTEHPLNLDIHYQSDNTFSGLAPSVTAGTGTANRDNSDGIITADYIRRQFLNGQDVELAIDWFTSSTNFTASTMSGGHIMVVSGILADENGLGVYINDDAKQDGTNTGLRTDHFSRLKNRTVGGASYLYLDGEPTNLIDAVIVESPKPNTVAVVPKENSNSIDIFDLFGLIGGVPNADQEPAPAAGVPGGLTLVPGSPFAAGSQAVAAAAALGTFLYVTNYGSNNVSGYRIDPTARSLTPLAGSPFAAGVNPFSIAVDLTGRLAYVANSGNATISAYTIDPITGALTPVPGSPFASAAGTNAVALSPSGKLLFASAGGGVSVYTIDVATGVLTAVAGSPFGGGTAPFFVAAEPHGQFVYEVDAGTSKILGFKVGSSGSLTAVPGSPFATGTQPVHVAIDPTGNFVYVANFTASNVSAFSINSATGALTPVTGSPYTVPAGPFGVSTDPVGRYLYVASQGNNPGAISAFSINPLTGALTQLSGSPYSVAGGPARLITVPLFPTTGPANVVPSIGQLAPSAARSGASALILTVYGKNFAPGAVVRWNGAGRATTFISSTQLNTAIPASDLAAAGTPSVTVTNPAPGGGNSSALSFTVNASAAPPSVPGNGTLNDAGFTIGQAVAPGSIAASFGSGLATGTSTLSSPPVNTLLGAGMLMNGSIVAPLFFASPGQLVYQVPWELAGQQRAAATFTGPGGTSSPATITLAPYAPGIFTMNAAGQGAIVINATGELVSQPGVIPGFPSRPAAKGEYIAIYCTGLGDVTNPPATGAPSSADPNNLSYTKAAPTVSFGKVTAAPYFSGLAPTYVGLYQIVVQVPTAAPSGANVPLVISIGGQNSNTVTIAIQ